jgi:hypothetical protein
VKPGGHVFVVDHRWHPWPAHHALRLVQTSFRNLGLIRFSVFERIESPREAVA